MTLLRLKFHELSEELKTIALKKGIQAGFSIQAIEKLYFEVEDGDVAAFPEQLQICTDCKQLPAMHTIYLNNENQHICCKCFVNKGNAPSDWHSLCMMTYNLNKGKKYKSTK